MFFLVDLLGSVNLSIASQLEQKINIVNKLLQINFVLSFYYLDICVVQNINGCPISSIGGSAAQ